VTIQGPVKTSHSRIAAGRYALSTHSGEKDKKRNIVKYQTNGYIKSPGIQDLPRPAIRYLSTGHREGILIHPGNGYIWSIGCFNPGKNLKTADDNLKFAESRSMVIAIIEDTKSYLGSRFPKSNNVEIPNAFAVIEGEPT
jgi:hypothetical protein